MYLWRRIAETQWVEAHQDLLKAHAHGALVLVQRPGRKRLEVEITCATRRDSSALVETFGGRIEVLPRNWLKQFARADSKPIKIGQRLIIVSSIKEPQSCSVRYPQRSSHRDAKPVALGTADAAAHANKAALLFIPASLAFGTGEHATTAMSLRFLEQLTRRWKPGWSLVDLGTGSGILALAATRFGAGQVTGIDNDPTAISMATSNARLNKIQDASFQQADVQKWSPTQKTDVITANLYSDLLTGILPKLRGGSWLILSGILRSQQDEFVSALKRNQLDVISTKRRGKWMAFLARSRSGGGVRCSPCAEVWSSAHDRGGHARIRLRIPDSTASRT